MVTIGIKGHNEVRVTEEMSATHIGSGSVLVFSTPMMISLMERTCQESVKPYLDEGDETVGIHVNVHHHAATPIGMDVWCDTEVVEVDRRRIVFKVAVYDKAGLVGDGFHERFIINVEKFHNKSEERRKV